MLSDHQRYVLAAKLHSYLDQYEDAIRVLDEGLERMPESPHLHRHRGHFHISTRRFGDAVDALERAAELAADMDDEIEYYQDELVPEMERVILGKEPERLAEPASVTESTLEELQDVYKATLKFSIWYHLSLARYLQGEFEAAIDGYRTTLDHCADDDMRAAATDWLYMSLRRTGRDDEARELLEDTDVENLDINESSYYRRLRMYEGVNQPEELFAPDDDDELALATQGYGVGNWHLYNGDEEAALEIFERIVEDGAEHAFGTIAAEADLEQLED